MREMVSRERHEKVAQMDAIAKMIARVYSLDAAKAFSDVLAEYASEVFQEAYDPKVLAHRVALRKRAQARVRDKRRQDEELLRRLDRMGEFYDQNPPEPTPLKKRSQNK
jgi:hypothetical protein